MAEPLKLMYSNERLRTFSKLIKAEHKSFDEKKFLLHFDTNEWKNAELKARVKLVANALYEGLPKSYDEAIAILIPVSKQMSWGYFGVVFPQYIEEYGLSNWKTSMKAIEEFTQTSTGEFAIRHFIVQDEERAMKQMLAWSKSKNHHVRRLSSEGCRSRLPWGMRLHSFVKSADAILPILENLNDDSELYVRKSVANNLNDISKDHPEVAIAIAKRWKGKSENTDWILAHGLRGLLKSGNKEALKIFGHHDAKGLSIENLQVDKKKLKIGDRLTFGFDVLNSNKKPVDARLEYAVHYIKSNGTSSAKVFQISKNTLSNGALSFSRSQRFEDFTTRKHYPGEHILAIHINGEEKARVSFQLVR